MRNVKVKPKDNYPRDKFGNKMTGAHGASKYDNTNYKEDPEWKVNRIRQEDFNYMPASELKRIKKESYNKMYGGSLTNDSIIQDRHYENYSRATQTYLKKYGEAPTLPTKSAKDIRITNSKKVTPISVNKNTQRIEYKQNTNKPQQSTEKFGNSALTKGRVEAAKFSGLSKSSQKKQGVVTRKNSIKNPNNKEFVNKVAFNLGVDPSKVTQKQFNSRYNPKRVKKQ